MKTKFLKRTLITVLLTLSVLLGANHSLNRSFDSMTLSNVEALSEEESLKDPVWKIDLTASDGVVRVKCTSGGEYVCPMWDPNAPVYI